MENSEFDKYIKSHRQKDLDVPEGLSWEEMNIPLPGKKKKRRGFFWVWFVLLGIVLGGSIVMLLQPKQEIRKSIVKEDIVSQKNQSEPKVIAKNIPSEVNKIPSDVIQSDTPISSGNNSTSKKDIRVVKTRTFKNNKVEQNVETSKSIVLVEDVTMPLQNATLNKSSNDISQNSKNEISNSIFTIQNIDGIGIGLLTKDRALPQLDWIEIPQDEDKKKSKLSLFVNFGINQSQSNYSQGIQSDALTMAEDVAFGNSFQLGVKFPLKKKFFVITGFSYQKLHTTFTYSEDLGMETSLVLNQRITRVKNIFHNNYFEFAELNIGVGKEFDFGKNWGSQLTLSFNPSYQLKATGRTINEDLSVFEMENHKSVDRLFWSVDGGLDLFFNVKNNRILAGVDLKRSLSTIQLLENSDLQLQPQILTFKLGIERRF